MLRDSKKIHGVPKWKWSEKIAFEEKYSCVYKKYFNQFKNVHVLRNKQILWIQKMLAGLKICTSF